MNRITQKLNNITRRKHRVRAVVSGTTERPRLSVFVSNRHITAQIIDDTKHVTLAYSTTIGSKINGSMTEKATAIGSAIAKKAATAKINKVVFDRGSKLYHGRVKALANAAREAGLEF
ncbi:50S ribosomal protein L18 [Candidatus Saccharibacteria bacterium]|nr:50S ribosomal protein L18 [Candidatus Saccharibacteria bacterium]MBI3338156.1 50S ribosomal protein L18 [Candidatus Saccharibacteria bacterium]